MRNTKRWSRMLVAFLAAGTLISSSVSVHATTVDVTGTGSTSDAGGSRYDGNVDGTLTNGSTDIDVQAKVTGGAEIVYDLDITYGNMQFEYDYGSSWNPTTHSYTAGNSGAQSGGWVTAGYVDGNNNKITVTNNSNFPMTAAFSYTASGTPLNASSSAAGSVVGIFADANNTFTANNAALLAGGYSSAGVAGLDTKTVDLEMNTTGLIATNIYYYKTTNDSNNSDNATKDVFFALSGRPDVGGPTTLTTVGKITVAISPATGVTKATK